MTRTKFFVLLFVVLLLLTSACTSSTEFGDCVGLAEDKDSSLVYEVDVGNVVWAILLSETIVVPVIVILSETVCPTGRK